MYSEKVVQDFIKSKEKLHDRPFTNEQIEQIRKVFAIGIEYPIISTFFNPDINIDVMKRTVKELEIKHKNVEIIESYKKKGLDGHKVLKIIEGLNQT